MSNKRNGNTDTVETQVAATSGNFVLTLKRADHPGNRSSYGVPGNHGNVVFFNTLFANGVPPATITLDVALVDQQAKVDKSAEAAAKAIEKAEKLAAKLAAQQAKAIERQAKAEKAMEAAKARVAAAEAKVAV
jgi:hypothetical protein